MRNVAPGALGRLTVGRSIRVKGGGTGIANEFRREYDSFGRMTKEQQEHDGVVKPASNAVTYGYPGARLTSVQYPSGYTLTYGYSGDWGDAGIVTSVSDGSGVIESYGYEGLSTIVRKD